MGTELEFKLAVPQPALLETIFSDPIVTQVRQGDLRLLNMATVYYDTADGALRQRRWTLRLRQENDCLVATVKTPGEGRARSEWACEAVSIESALEPLIAQGAPAELAELTAGRSLDMVCGARFSRRAVDLVFPDGTVCELSGDVGELLSGCEKVPLCEAELELKEGSEKTVAAFAETLMERFGLREEPLSKFARAAVLADRK